MRCGYLRAIALSRKSCVLHQVRMELTQGSWPALRVAWCFPLKMHEFNLDLVRVFLFLRGGWTFICQDGGFQRPFRSRSYGNDSHKVHTLSQHKFSKGDTSSTLMALLLDWYSAKSLTGRKLGYPPFFSTSKIWNCWVFTCNSSSFQSANPQNWLSWLTSRLTRIYGACILYTSLSLTASL